MLPDNGELVGIPVLQFGIGSIGTNGDDSATGGTNTEGPGGNADVLWLICTLELTASEEEMFFAWLLETTIDVDAIAEDDPII